jgi:magnesium chelatase accessory protein
MTGRLDWARDGHDWPNRESSHFEHAAGLRWHVQRMGAGPAALLLHGTGASTHSWRTFAPLLARHCEVVVPDLPGHGFTDTPPTHRLSLASMAEAMAALVRKLTIDVRIAIGHSAGAAVLARMALDGQLRPDRIIAVNGAFLPFRGVPGRVFQPLARMLAGTQIVPQWFARRAADPRLVGRLLESTGSNLEPSGVEFYRRLAQNPVHVAGALAMMANWDLPGLARDLPRLATPLSLVVGGNDGTVPATEAFRVRELVPHATVHYLRGLGHLAHEERAAEVVDLVMQITRSRKEEPAPAR